MEITSEWVPFVAATTVPEADTFDDPYPHRLFVACQSPRPRRYPAVYVNESEARDAPWANAGRESKNASPAMVARSTPPSSPL